MNNSSFLNDSLSVPENTTVAASTNHQIVVNAIIGGVVFILCSLTVSSILLTKSLRNKEKLCYLAIICSDLVLGCQILFVRLIPITFNSDHPLCHFQLWNGILLLQATMFSNVMVTSERFVSVVLPFRFSEKVTWKRLLVVYVIIWIIAIVLTYSMFADGFGGSPVCQFLTAGNRHAYAVLGSFMCFIVLLDFSLYIFIIKVARRHIRQIAATMVDGSIDTEGRDRASYIKKREFRATLTVGIITLAFGISYFPMGSHLIYYGIFSSLNTQTRTFNVMITMLMLNSLMNPMIYIWRLKSCRREMINRILCRPNDTDNDISRITTRNR